MDIFVAANYGSISVKEFKHQLDVKTGRLIINSTSIGLSKQGALQPPFLEFLDLELEEMKRDVGIRKNSIKPYKMHAEILKRFAREVRPFNYEDVDWNFRLELIDWLAGRNCKLAYGNKTLSVLRQFLERARKKKLHTNVLYQGTGWMVAKKKAVGEKVILNSEELQRLADLKLFDFADKVRDLFLIGAGTGQRFSDYSRYSFNNFYKTINGIPILSIISQKTDTPAKIPLNIFSWLIANFGESGSYPLLVESVNWNPSGLSFSVAESQPGHTFGA